MPRNKDDARLRLRMAALELFRERGYDGTTAAEIAARAGVTERTFFRHFPDKREVLFEGEAAFHAALTKAIVEAPEALGPMEALLWAFRSVEQLFIDNRPFTAPAHEVIARTPALQERQLGKTATTIAVVAAAVRQRGVEPNLATLAAGAGMAAFSHAAQAWVADPSISLETYLNRAFVALQGLSAAGSLGRG